MKKIIKRFGGFIGVLAGLGLIAVVLICALSETKSNRNFNLPIEQISVPTDIAAINEGKRLVTFRGCTECHKPNLGGGEFINAPIGKIDAPNLTRGKGGLTNFTDADYVRAIRHGVSKNGRGLWIMPADDYKSMSDADVGKIIAYIKSIPAVDNEASTRQLTLLGRALVAFGQIPLISADRIDHTVKAPAMVDITVSVESGKYLADTCQGCHNPRFNGGPVLGSAPNAPIAANLTPAGNLKNWSETQFIAAMRTGKTPEGKQIDPQNMPWPSFALMKDDEIKAIFMYLKTLPPTATGAR